MHIMEGYLPPAHAAAWTGVAAVFVMAGVRRIKAVVRADPRARFSLAAAGGFAMVLSALKLPSVTGSSSHPTGTGLGAVLFGPSVMAVLGTIVLLFQALLLAHGGLTTLGANVVSMAVAGPYTAFAVYQLLRWAGGAMPVAVFAAAFFGNLATYATTAVQLALAFPDGASGFYGSLLKFLAVFAVTQVPLAVIEGLLTVMVMQTFLRFGMGHGVQGVIRVEESGP